MYTNMAVTPQTINMKMEAFQSICITGDSHRITFIMGLNIEKSALIETMACYPVGDKTLSKPVLTHGHRCIYV